MADTVSWPGASGNIYKYWFHDLSSPIKAEAGNYMFVKRLPSGNYVPVYIGQCDDLRNRCVKHERMADAIAAGATHFMAHTTPAGEHARLAEERDLIQKWSPMLNVHHRQAG